MTLKHRGDNPHAGHERAVGLGIEELHAETAALCQSEIACAVADAWAGAQRSPRPFQGLLGALPAGMAVKLNRLEEATRTSRLRKVRP